MWNTYLTRPTLIRKDHTDSKFRRNAHWQFTRQRPTGIEHPADSIAGLRCPARPRGRDDRQIDFAAIRLPDVLVHHVRADGETDPTQFRLDDQRLFTMPEIKVLPENQVPFAI